MKPPLLFGTPRSGSSIAYSLLADYYEAKLGTRGLGEYLNLNYHSFWDAGAGIQESVFPSTVVPSKPIPAELYNHIGSQRISWLKKYHGKYFFKMLTGHGFRSDLTWLADSYDWIFIERRDLFDQLLSFLVSVSTGFWYLPKGIPFEKESLTVSAEQISLFEEHIFEYQLLKRRQGAGTILYYEDFLSCKVPTDYLKSIGLYHPGCIQQTKIPEKQNQKNKILRFKNKKFIMNYYKNSMLNSLFPLSRSEVSHF